MQQQKIVRTKMSQAMIEAVHTRINQGFNTGNIGRVVLTNEAKGVGIKYVARTNKGTK